MNKFTLLLLPLLLGCGAQIGVSGKVELEHTVNVEALLPYIQAACHRVTPDDVCYSTNVTECTNCLIGMIIDKSAQ